MRCRFSIILILFLLSAGSTYGLDNSTTLYIQGKESFKEGDRQKAEKLFKESIKLNKSYCLPWYGLGRVYLAQKSRLKDSIEALKTSVSLDPSFSRGYFYLGMAYLFNDEHVPALHAFKEAYRLNPSLRGSLYNIGVIHEYLMDDFKAFVFYRKYYKALEKKDEPVF